MKKFISVIIAVMMCVTLVSACKNKENEEQKKDNSKQDVVVATIGDTKITQGYYNLVYNFAYLDTYQYLYQQASQYMTNGEESWLDVMLDEERTIGDYIRENTYLQIEQLTAITALAKEKGITVDEDIKKAAKKQKDDIIESYGGKEAFAEFLRDSKSNQAAVDTYLQAYEIYGKYFDEITKEGEDAYVEEGIIKNAFKEDISGKMKVQHILVSTQDDYDENGVAIPGKTDEEAQKIVKEILDKLAKGEDFDALISEYDEDPGMESGKFYVFGDGEMVQEFETASKNLKIGEYTKQGVKTDYGYHIIKRYALDENSEEYESFKNTYLEEKVLEIVTKKVEEIKKDWKKEEIDSYVDNWNKDRKE